jgi:hypothetical protein
MISLTVQNHLLLLSKFVNLNIQTKLHSDETIIIKQLNHAGRTLPGLPKK